MGIDSDIRRKIITRIERCVVAKGQRDAIIDNALFDCNLANLVDREGSAAVFARSLTNFLLRRDTRLCGTEYAIVLVLSECKTYCDTPTGVAIEDLIVRITDELDRDNVDPSTPATYNNPTPQLPIRPPTPTSDNLHLASVPSIQPAPPTPSNPSVADVQSAIPPEKIDSDKKPTPVIDDPTREAFAARPDKKDSLSEKPTPVIDNPPPKPEDAGKSDVTLPDQNAPIESALPDPHKKGSSSDKTRPIIGNPPPKPEDAGKSDVTLPDQNAKIESALPDEEDVSIESTSDTLSPEDSIPKPESKRRFEIAVGLLNICLIALCGLLLIARQFDKIDLYIVAGTLLFSVVASLIEDLFKITLPKSIPDLFKHNLTRLWMTFGLLVALFSLGYVAPKVTCDGSAGCRWITETPTADVSATLTEVSVLTKTLTPIPQQTTEPEPVFSATIPASPFTASPTITPTPITPTATLTASLTATDIPISTFTSSPTETPITPTLTPSQTFTPSLEPPRITETAAASLPYPILHVVVGANAAEPFWIDKYEVSNSRYYGSALTSDQPPNNPVERIPYNLAREFCQQGGGDLPLREQWELAAGAAQGNVYPWGADMPDARHAHYGSGISVDVDRFTFSAGVSVPYGLWHMAGNVAEWTLEQDGVVWAYGGAYDGPGGDLQIQNPRPYPLTPVPGSLANANNAYGGIGFRCAYAKLP